jgi:hypothetical protein
MEYEGSITFFCTVCSLQGMMLREPGTPLCPRCGSEVMTPHPVRERASVQPVYS